MRDPKTETILPIYDFISTSHNSLTVSKYLMTFKKKIEMVAPAGSLKIAPIIVVDFSWPFINSILEVFSSCTIELYLETMFKLIVEKEKELPFLKVIKTRVYLCSTHFLKMIVTKERKIESNNRITKIFILSFCKIQSLLKNLLTILKIFSNYLN